MTPERYRCALCGNKTRFDVFESLRRRSYRHYTLGGEVVVEEEEILDVTVERVVCHWCNRADGVEEIAES